MSDPKLPRGPKQSIPVQLGSGRSSEASGEIESLEEQLNARGASEEEADLSILDGEGLAIEAQREELRKHRAGRRDATLANEDKRKKRREERRAQRVYRLLLVYAVAVATAVIVVGLCEGETDFVRDGMVGLCTVCGFGIYRLQPFSKRLRGS